VVTDEDCIQKMSISKCQREGFMEDPMMELALSGGVADHYRLKDLPQLDLTRYKMVIFAYTFDVSSEMREYLENNLPKNTLLVFHHAAGIRNDGVCSLENIRDFTGFTMEERMVPENYAGVEVCDKQALALFDGVWQKDRRIAITTPYQKANIYRSLALLAGCKLWSDGGLTLWADNRMMGVFTLDKLHGMLTLPHPGTYREAISGKVFRDVLNIHLDDLDSNAAVFVPEV